MRGELLRIKSFIVCPHGGRAVLFTSNKRVTREGSLVLVEIDIHPVIGCPFTIGQKYSPCVRIEWKAGHNDTFIDGIRVLYRLLSTGTCYNAEGAPQGTAVIVTP